MLLLSLDCSTYPWSVPYNAECLSKEPSSTIFESLVWLDLWLNPGLSDHYQVMLITRIHLILLHHMFLSSISLGMFFRWYPMFVLSWLMYVFAGRYWLTNKDLHYIIISLYEIPPENFTDEFFLTSPAVPACLVRLTLMVCEIRSKRMYLCCFVGCCFQDLLKITRSILE